MTHSKEIDWQGYFDHHKAGAKEHRMDPVDFLDEIWFDGQRHAGEVLRYAGPDSDILEIGCGLGRVSRHVVAHCRSLVCTDIIDEALAETRRVIGEAPGVTYHKNNGYDLASFEDGSFDLVYSFGTFFHLDFEVVVNYLREIGRVLRTGGIGMLEFKGFRKKDELLLLLSKIEEQGIAEVEAGRTKFRYVSPQMLLLVCAHFGLKVLNDDVVTFTFEKIDQPDPGEKVL